jgi:hydrogenase maturation protease
MRHRVLVACVGNIFLCDDGFGSEVARALAARELPAEARVVDYGIGSVHLVYDLLDGYDVLVLVDTVAQQEGPPGTLYVIEPDLPPRDPVADPFAAVPFDAHDLPPAGAMTLVPSLGGSVDRIVVVGCQPQSLADGIGLSTAVQAAVDPAVQLVVDVVDQALARLAAEASPSAARHTDARR